MSHRLSLAKAAKRKGFEVIVLTSLGNHKEAILENGFIFEDIAINRSSINPFSQLVYFFKVVKVYASYKPNLVHHIALKPILLGTLAAYFFKNIKVINTFPGMGILFTKNSMKFVLIRLLIIRILRFLLNSNSVLSTVQNKSDYNYLLNNIKVQLNNLSLILGSGVDIKTFYYQEETLEIPRVTMVSRLLWDKGVEVLIESSRLLKAKKVSCNITLVGWSDSGNKYSAIPNNIIKEWVDEGLIDFWGKSDDVPKVWRESHICVFPTSYPEGLPKTLLEAAASGRPIITTDIPGCLEIVQDQVNGIIIPQDDPEMLTRSIEILLKDPLLRKNMGLKGREKVIANFSDEVIIQQTMNLYSQLLN